MRLKTLSNLYILAKLIKKFLLAAMVITIFIFIIFFLPAVLLSDLFFIKIGNYILSILGSICLILIMIYKFNDFLYKKLSLDITDDDKSIIFYLINRKHKFIKLNLEIKKLAKAFNNHSNIYNELNNEDFPYINKFLRRAKALIYVQKQNNTNSSNEAGVASDNSTDKQVISINTKNVEKLNLSENPKLLTLDSVDNELNNLIFHQMNALKQEKV